MAGSIAAFGTLLLHGQVHLAMVLPLLLKEAWCFVSLCADYTAQSGAYQDTETSSLMLTLFIRLEALSTKDPDLFVCLGRESGVKAEPLLDEAA